MLVLCKLRPIMFISVSKPVLIILPFTLILVVLGLLVGDAIATDQLAYEGEIEGRRDIYTLDLTRGLTQRLTHSDQDSYSPVWLPDGERLGFITDMIGYRRVVTLQAGEQKPQSVYTIRTGDFIALAWSPKGNQLAFTASFEGWQALYIADIDTDNTRQITATGSNAFSPTWSPDGSALAFSWSPVANAEVYVIAADETAIPVANTDHLVRITSDPGLDTNPAWSPDGTRIAFTSDRGGSSDIYVANVDGTDLRRVTTHKARDTTPRWSTDGSTLVFSSNRDRTWELYAVPVACLDQPDGTCDAQTRRLTYNRSNDFNANWRP